MKLDLRHAIVAALALGAAGSAAAIDITTVPTANILYASGSTAIDAALKTYFYNLIDTKTLCDSTQGAIDVYSQASGTQASKFTAVACMSNVALVNDGAATPASVAIAIIKEDGAGSLNGVSALQNISFSGSPFTDGHLNFPAVSSLTSTACSAATAKAATTSLQAFTNRQCTGFTATPIVPQLGFSDVEGTLFTGTDPTTPVALLSGSTVEVVFAPAVSLGLYHALQAVEGKTVGSDLPADMPSLTRSQLSTIYSGKVPAATGWNWIKNSAGAAVGGQSVVWGGATGNCWNGTASVACATPLTTSALPSAASLFICRRGNNSGSEKSAEVFFNDFGCAQNTYPFASPSVPALCATSATDGCGWTQATGIGKLVFAGNGTGDLLDCLNGQDAAGHFAIGFASTDNLSGSAQSNVKRTDFRYIRVDGVVPSIENAASGKYPFVSQSFWYAAPKTSSWSALLASGAVADAMLTVITTNTTESIGSVGSVVGVNGASVNTGQGIDGGVLAIPGVNGATPSAASATPATFAANPVSAVYKTQGSTTNNCVRALQYPTAADVAADGNPAWGGPL